jgi:hypothetical protein
VLAGLGQDLRDVTVRCPRSRGRVRPVLRVYSAGFPAATRKSGPRPRPLGQENQLVAFFAGAGDVAPAGRFFARLPGAGAGWGRARRCAARQRCVGAPCRPPELGQAPQGGRVAPPAAQPSELAVCRRACHSCRRRGSGAPRRRARTRARGGAEGYAKTWVKVLFFGRCKPKYLGEVLAYASNLDQNPNPKAAVGSVYSSLWIARLHMRAARASLSNSSKFQQQRPPFHFCAHTRCAQRS